MNEPSDSRQERWKSRLKRIRAGAKNGGIFAAGIVAALLGLLLYNVLFPGPHVLNQTDVSNTVNSILASATPAPAFSETVYQIIRPSLVLIQAQSPGTDGKTVDDLGSGVIIDDAGDIMTSLHVVANSSAIQVTFADGTQATGQIAIQQPQNDIAVLQTDKEPKVVVAAVLGNPNSMQVGDEAYAVGNPFGLYGSMSAGVISGFNRTFEPSDSNVKLTGLIQIDAAVNPGNSGGPLLNRYGEVIGIVEGIINPSGQNVFAGIGFAVPITTAGGAFGSPPD
jgi:S1-C subfamily serine protease